jgi:hypothetical protein
MGDECRRLCGGVRGEDHLGGGAESTAPHRDVGRSVGDDDGDGDGVGV